MKNLTLEQLIVEIEKGVSEANFTGVEFKSDWGQPHGRDISAIANCFEIANGWVVSGVDNNGRPCGKDARWLKDIEQKVSSHLREYLTPSWAVTELVGHRIGSSDCLFIGVRNQGDVVKWGDRAYKLIGTSSIEMKPHEM